MSKYLKFASLAVVATVGFAFTSCSDDDDDNLNPGSVTEPTTETVFPDGLPAQVDGAAFTLNEKGQVTKIVEGSTTTTFEYGSFTPSRANNFTVLMKERDTYDEEDGYNMYMQLNSMGFVEYAYQEYLDGDDADEWWFEYNSDGQLTRLKRSEGGDDFKITYTNGDITKVVQEEEDGDHREYTIAYTNSDYASVVANKGNIMLFDDFFQIDMDEMGIAYFAGLLGKATKNLPMAIEETGKEGGSTYTYSETYHWVFNSNQLPTKFWEGDYEYDAVTFSWK